MVDTKNYGPRAYFNVQQTLQEAGDTNSRELNTRQLEYVLVVGAFPEVRFTEKLLSQILGNSPSTVSETVSGLVSKDIFDRQTEHYHNRGARVVLTSTGTEVYNSLATAVERAIEEDAIGRKRPIF